MSALVDEFLFQDDFTDPVGSLRSLAMRLPEGAEREGVLKDLDALEALYPPESNQYLAPNGKPSNLSHAQWYAVRTPSFKRWFGDWERAARIAGVEWRQAKGVEEAAAIVRDAGLINKPLKNTFLGTR